ncbi:hypothetical protein D3C75_826170 [compost metagenome]
MGEIEDQSLIPGNNHIGMETEALVILTAAGFGQKLPVALPIGQIAGTVNTLPLPFIHNHPVPTAQIKHIGAFMGMGLHHWSRHPPVI